MAADHAQKLVFCEQRTPLAHILVAEGLLDSTTYLSLRDAIIKASLDDPPAVLVDVTLLQASADSAWAVFTSARWHIGQWPDIPLLLVCQHRNGRDRLVRNGIIRYVPVYASTADAMDALSEWHSVPVRRRARLQLTATAASVPRSRHFVHERLMAWSKPDQITVAKMVVTILVENVLAHTDSAPAVRLESKDDLVTVAVEDGSTAPAVRRERSRQGCDGVSGLAIVAALCRKWGNSPTSSGKTVWATIGPENRL